MKLICVSITILAISIGGAWSQVGLPQPKAIRNNGYYQQEVFYGGNSGGAQIQPQFQHHQPIFTQRVNSVQGFSNPHAVPLIKTAGVVPTPPPVPITTTTTYRTTTTPSVAETENIPLAFVRKLATTETPRTTTESLTSDELEDQAKSAHYNFGTSVHDTINDHEHVRSEVRDGLKLAGMYSYSDGFFKRTVHYEADENGYRVTKEEVTPINGAGPKFNPKGSADVKNTLAGDYKITVDDFKLNKQQEKILKETL